VLAIEFVMAVNIPCLETRVFAGCPAKQRILHCVLVFGLALGDSHERALFPFEAV